MLIKVKVIPEAKEIKITKKSIDSFEVKVKIKPIQGAATREVKYLLSKYFKVDISKVRLIKGFKERNKIFDIDIN